MPEGELELRQVRACRKTLEGPDRPAGRRECTALAQMRDEQAYLAHKHGAPLEYIAEALGVCRSEAKRHIDAGRDLFEGPS